MEGRWRVPSCACVDFFPPAYSASRCSQRVSGSVYAARVLLLFSAKMTERLEADKGITPTPCDNKSASVACAK